MVRVRNWSVALILATAFATIELLVFGMGIFCRAQLLTATDVAVQAMYRDMCQDMPSLRVLGALGKNARYLDVDAKVKKFFVDDQYQASVWAQSETGETSDVVARILANGTNIAEKAATATTDSEAKVPWPSSYWIIGALGCGVVIGFLMRSAIARSQSKTAEAMLAQLQAIAKNNLDIDDIEVKRNDEIGRASSALNVMKNSLSSVVQLIADTATRVAGASDELFAARAQITTNSDEASANVKNVSLMSQQVSDHLHSVSSVTEHMVVTVQGIAVRAKEASKVAGEAVQTAKAANDTIAKLVDSSSEIGEVVKAITSIAEQTNLLALNATIEAARAGEVGKGFAVVANDVKELANQTAIATDDISRKITAIQSDINAGIEAVGMITSVINQVNQISSAIAVALEQQSGTADEMKQRVCEAAAGAEEISASIDGVAKVAEGTSFRAQESNRAAQELAEVAKLLGQLIGQFKIKRRDPRVDVPLKVTLITNDAKGVQQEHFVETVNVSRRGALLSGFRGELRNGQLVCLARMGKKEVFRVSRVGVSNRADQIGLSAEDPNSSIWDDVLNDGVRNAVDQTSSKSTLTMAANA